METSADSAIRTDALTKVYGELAAVDHLDLQVYRGEVFGFLGPNGAGKSTTIRCILDLSAPTSGSAAVLGLDSHRDSMAIRRRIGFLPGDLALYSNLTGQEMVDYFANLRGGVDGSFIDELAERFDADLSKKCSDYSSGNRQKVGLIQAFMHRPDLVVLDEPSTGLDPLVQQEFHNLVNEVAAEGRTVFLSSHTLSEVERVADRVGIIRHGKLVEVSTMADLKAKAIRALDLEFAQDIDPDRLRAIDGVREVTGEGRLLTVSYDGSIEPLLLAATEVGVINLRSREADLEKIFLTFYRDEAEGEGASDASGRDGLEARGQVGS